MNINQRFRLSLALLLVSGLAWGQWQWIDSDGRKVFSDLAPPASVPEKNILKRPGQARTPAPLGSVSQEDALVGSAAGVKPAAVTASAAPRISGVDKDLAEKKKKAEEAEAAKLKVEQEKRQLARADNCSRARQSKATLESGMRLSRINSQGEREVLEEAARSAELQRVQAIIDADCR